MDMATRTPRLYPATFGLLLVLGTTQAVAVDRLYDHRFEQWTSRAQKGDARAQYDLANAYLRGNGVTINVKKAVAWLEKSAAQGYVRAQYRLGYLYLTGKGVTQDFAKAFRLLRNGARKDYSPAQFYLSRMYARGNGVEQDYGKALYWMRQAAASDYYGAKKEIPKLQAAVAARRAAAAKAAAEEAAAAKAQESTAAAQAPTRKSAVAEASPQPVKSRAAPQAGSKSAAKPKAPPQAAAAQRPIDRKPEVARTAAPRRGSRTAKTVQTSVSPKDKPAAIDSRKLLLQGHWLNEGGTPAKHMPSALSTCTGTGNQLVCKTGALERSNIFASVRYMVRATFGQFRPNGRFTGSYRTKVLAVSKEAVDGPNPSEEDVPSTGWKARTLLRCRFKDADHIDCVNDNFQYEHFTRQSLQASATH
jgi:hypothetical protein